jgi:hypothetical protein
MRTSFDRRILGGFRCVDAVTNLSVLNRLSIASGPLVVRPNRSGVYAFFDGPGFHDFTTQFLAPISWPVSTPFEVTIRDPRLRYLPRRKQVQVPQALPIAAPQDVTLYPAPSAAVQPNWAVVHASIVNKANPDTGLAWAALQIISAGKVLATGVADARGEALLAVAGLGLQVSSSGGGAVTETTIAATAQAWYDPAVAGRPLNWIPNPDDILQNLSATSWKTGSEPVQLGPGLTKSLTIKISL